MMTVDVEANDAAVRNTTLRRQDGAIYKAMAFVPAFLIAMPLGYALTRPLSASSQLVFVVTAFFVFDAGWDLAVLASGRGDMLAVEAPRAIMERALTRAADLGLVLLIFELPGEFWLVAAGFLVARTLAAFSKGRR